MPQNEIDILKELATLDPLDDEKIIHMNGEIVLTANGKLIRVDSLRETTAAFINMDGQIKASEFPFKRHVFYTAVIYANGIQKGDSWEKLKPVISIVVS